MGVTIEIQAATQLDAGRKTDYPDFFIFPT